MSVAVPQRQLSASRLGDVPPRPYFTDLCRSIAASMIANRDQLALEVNAGESVTAANVSVSLGLIATELVISALKPAFPGHRPGRVLVSYRSDASGWSLSIEDDGVGMPAALESARTGLGTRSVEALAKQLNARVENADTNPGAMVSIVHG
jgi:two-component sensor histidine kinase